jgi:hypothetical protein
MSYYKKIINVLHQSKLIKIKILLIIYNFIIIIYLKKAPHAKAESEIKKI